MTGHHDCACGDFFIGSKSSELCIEGTLKSCLVPEGRTDVHTCVGPTGEWDTAAAQCIVEEAGGTFTVQNRVDCSNKRESMIKPDIPVSGAGQHRWLDYLD